MDCVNECPENALSLAGDTAPPLIALEQSLCGGVACRRCEKVCPEKVLELDRFFITSGSN
jgi:ferredoxin